MTSEAAWFSRLTIAAAGILGAVGVMAAAGATHLGDTRILGSLALIALSQAPAVLVLALLAGRHWSTRIATLLIGGGAIVFSIDLIALHFMGASPLPIMAPIGGTAMILGWLALIPAAFPGSGERLHGTCLRVPSPLVGEGQGEGARAYPDSAAPPHPLADAGDLSPMKRWSRLCPSPYQS